MKCKVDTIFLKGKKGGLEYGLGDYFKKTDEINTRTDGCFILFDGYSNDNNNTILPRDGKDILFF